MSRAFSYARFSAEKQRLGDSLRRQVESTRRYCDAHGLNLDESFTFRDLGVSGFRSRNLSEGALGSFLNAIESGKVPKGSVLVVESLDRLSRDQISVALQLFLRIITAGVDIVTLEPERRHTQATINDLGGMLEPIVIMSRANEESAMKSHRASEVWKQKRKGAREGKPVGRHCPYWLEYHDGGYRQVVDRVALIRTMYRMRSDGQSFIDIKKAADASGVSPKFGRHWSLGTLNHLLTTRTVLGEYQPTRYVERKQVPEGDPIAGYYPAIVDLATWHAAQGRIVNKGRGNKEGHINLFKGLMVDRDGIAIHLVTNHQRHGKNKYVYHRLMSLARKDKMAGAPDWLIDYDKYEEGFLRYVAELDPADFAPKGGEDVARQIAAATGSIAELDHKMATVKTRIKGSKDIDAFLDLLASLDAERKQTVATLERLKTQQSNAKVDAVGEVRSLAGMLADVEGDERTALRKRIKGRLAQLVESIAIEVKFTDEGVRRRGRGLRRGYEVYTVVTFADWLVRIFIQDQEGVLVPGREYSNELMRMFEVRVEGEPIPADVWDRVSSWEQDGEGGITLHVEPVVDAEPSRGRKK